MTTSMVSNIEKEDRGCHNKDEDQQPSSSSDLLSPYHGIPLSMIGSTALLSSLATGKGIRVGILDTGIDPACVPDVVDVYDCTGSGDVLLVDASMENTSDNNDDETSSSSRQSLLCLSGKRRIIPDSWKIQPFPSSSSSSANAAAAPTLDSPESKKLKQETPIIPPTSSLPKVKIGILRGYELFPKDLVSRLQKEREQVLEHSFFAPERARILHTIRTYEQSILQLQQQQQNKKDTTSSSIEQQRKLQEQLNEWKARLDLLNNHQNNNNNNNNNNGTSGSSRCMIEDPGPLYDVIVFWDGQHYRTAIIEFADDLEVTPVPLLTAYGIERQYGTFGISDQLHYAIQFHDQNNNSDGGPPPNMVSIVCDCSPHGTHVASITKTVAPDCELISFKIGDPRIGTMETGTALCRALAMAAKLGCHVINLSYGEPVQIPNAGWILQHGIVDLVYKHHVVMVAAAGNLGPALGTVNAPGATNHACIGVAAYVQADMQQTLYSSLTEQQYQQPASSSSQPPDQRNPTPKEKEEEDRTIITDSFPETTFTWSSAGPCDDGDFGVDICAPGAAFTHVPNWCLQKSRLMNGTSMASPVVTGCIAQLLSAWNSQSGTSTRLSPERIRLALVNTALPISDVSPHQQGWGLIQVDKAFEFLKQETTITTNSTISSTNTMDEDDENRQEYDTDVWFDVRVNMNDHRSGQRGIYLRQPQETEMAQTFTVLVEPQFRPPHDRQQQPTKELQEQKIKFEKQFWLSSTVPWVQTPQQFVLSNQVRSFALRVDPMGLSPGVHTARVLATNTDKEKQSILFSVPITVIRPLPTLSFVKLGALEFQPAEIKRFFVVPPPGATWMDLTFRDGRDDPSNSKDDQNLTICDGSTRTLAVHTIQVLPHTSFRQHESNRRLDFLPGQMHVMSVAIEHSVTCEVTLARYWSTRGPTILSEASVRFRGLRPVPDEIHLVAGSGGTMVHVHSDLNTESLLASAKLTKWQVPLRPKSSSSSSGNGGSLLTNPIISPLLEDDRDRVFKSDKTMYQLVLTYEFEQEEKGSFIPRAPALNEVLYESGWESQCMLIFDGEKRYLGMSDAYPSSIQAPKGTVTIRLQIRHDDPSKLEKLKDLVIWIERSLAKDIVLTAYSRRDDMMLGRNPLKKRTLRKGTSAPVFFAEPVQSKLPSGSGVGHILFGVASFGSGDASLPGENKRPGGFPVFYYVGPKPNKEASVEANPPEPSTKPTTEQKMQDAVRDYKLDYLGKLTAEEKRDGTFDKIYENLSKEYPDHLPLLMIRLRHLATIQPRNPEQLPGIVQAAEAVINRISEDELALNLGRKLDDSDAEAIKMRDEIKEKKNMLIEALFRMTLVYAENDMSPSEATVDKFDETVKRLKTWVDIENTKYAAVAIAKEQRMGNFALAIKTVNKLLQKEIKEKDLIKSFTKTELIDMRIDFLEKLGYTKLAECEKKNRAIACPKFYKAF